MRRSSRLGPAVALVAIALGSSCNKTAATPVPTDAGDVGALVDGDPAFSFGRTISGPVESSVQGEGRTAVILWEVSSGSPDYLYKFGQAIVTNGRFSISLPSDPPAEAINSYGLGIGFVAVLPAGKTIANGKVPTGGFSTSDALGISTRHSIIWRSPTLTLPSNPSADFWPQSFPIGYACGACTPKPDGGRFEGFEPTACDEVRITTYSQSAMCNWT